MAGTSAGAKKGWATRKGGGMSRNARDVQKQLNVYVRGKALYPKGSRARAIKFSQLDKAARSVKYKGIGFFRT